MLSVGIAPSIYLNSNNDSRTKESIVKINALIIAVVSLLASTALASDLPTLVDFDETDLVIEMTGPGGEATPDIADLRDYMSGRFCGLQDRPIRVVSDDDRVEYYRQQAALNNRRGPSRGDARRLAVHRWRKSGFEFLWMGGNRQKLAAMEDLAVMLQTEANCVWAENPTFDSVQIVIHDDKPTDAQRRAVEARLDAREEAFKTDYEEYKKSVAAEGGDKKAKTYTFRRPSNLRQLKLEIRGPHPTPKRGVQPVWRSSLDFRGVVLYWRDPVEDDRTNDELWAEALPKLFASARDVRADSQKNEAQRVAMEDWGCRSKDYYTARGLFLGCPRLPRDEARAAAAFFDLDREAERELRTLLRSRPNRRDRGRRFR